MSKETIAAAERIVRKIWAKRGIHVGKIDTGAGIHQHMANAKLQRSRAILRSKNKFPSPGEYETGPDEEREDSK